MPISGLELAGRDETCMGWNCVDRKTLANVPDFAGMVLATSDSLKSER